MSTELTIGSYSEFVNFIVDLGRGGVSSYACVANVHMLVEAASDPEFAAIVNGADLVAPDGMPVVLALRHLFGIKQDRVAGMDLFPDILLAAERAGLTVFLYGSTDQVLTLILQRIANEHPRLKVRCYSPPFRNQSLQENFDDIERINTSGAQIICVSLGCPKQERWMAANKGLINGVMVGVGGAFPVYAGLQRRAPVILQRLALEWLYRLCQEPRRLFLRYLVTNTVFVYSMLHSKRLNSRQNDDLNP